MTMQKQKLSMLDITNKHVQDNEYISKIIVGIASHTQIQEIVESWKKSPEIQPIEDSWERSRHKDIDPRCWQMIK